MLACGQREFAYHAGNNGTIRIHPTERLFVADAILDNHDGRRYVDGGLKLRCHSILVDGLVRQDYIIEGMS